MWYCYYTIIMRLLYDFAHLFPNTVKTNFLEAMADIGSPCTRNGTTYEGAVGNVIVDFDCIDNTIVSNYTKTPMACKQKCIVHDPVLIKGIVANAVVINAAFETFKDFEFLGW